MTTARVEVAHAAQVDEHGLVGPVDRAGERIGEVVDDGHVDLAGDCEHRSPVAAYEAGAHQLVFHALTDRRFRPPPVRATYRARAVPRNRPGQKYLGHMS